MQAHLLFLLFLPLFLPQPLTLPLPLRHPPLPLPCARPTPLVGTDAGGRATQLVAANVKAAPISCPPSGPLTFSPRPDSSSSLGGAATIAQGEESERDATGAAAAKVPHHSLHAPNLHELEEKQAAGE